MIKTINTDIDVEINAQDIYDFLTDDYYNLNPYDRDDLLEIMKERVLDSSPLPSSLNINDMIYLFKNNSNLAREVKEYLNKNEVLQ